MREIEFCETGYFGGRCEPENIRTGFFHYFSTEGNTEDGIDPVAVVETESGEVLTRYVKQIRFCKPPDSKQLPDLLNNLESRVSAIEAKQMIRR